MISEKTVRLFIKGNKDAVTKVYNEYRNLMYFIIASYVSTPEDCEDLLSDAFIKAFDNRHSLKDINRLKSYLTAIAKNTALNFLNKKKELPGTEIIDELYGEEDQYNVMLNLLEPYLTNKETIVTYYKAVFSYTWSEIVEMTGIKESTARQLYASALKKLRKEFEK